MDIHGLGAFDWKEKLMNLFPSLDISREQFEEVLSQDPTKRFHTEDGDFMTSRNTAKPGNTFKDLKFRLRFLTATQRTTADDFQKSQKMGVIPFRFVHPNNGKKYSAWFLDKIKFSAEPTKSWTYKAEITVRVLGSYGIGAFGEGFYGS